MRAALQAQRGTLRQGEGAQVVDEARQQSGLIEDRSQVLRVRGIDAVEDPLEVALDHRQRRAQLMADVSEEMLARRLVGLEARAHGIECARQRAQLLGTAFGDPPREVPALDALGRADQVAERHRRAPQGAQRQQEHQHDEDDRDGEPGEPQAVLAAECTAHQPPHRREEQPCGNDRNRCAGDEAPQEAAPDAAPANSVDRRPRLAVRPPWRSSPAAPPWTAATVRHRPVGSRRRRRSGGDAGDVDRARSCAGCSSRARRSPARRTRSPCRGPRRAAGCG